ncbi:sialidase family protein [Zunongwangia endophytica]|uniref:Exo-alpha-sialidase n=1 Tax=Zunongwangia endophytica TaxID=1808945 RepID=A0ABV8H8I2_9FLAO|nr:sialidase family protein [Zunongwangia endophytica]MDN3595420.1 sialidase family protein [Zunongwangia endophytica]
MRTICIICFVLSFLNIKAQQDVKFEVLESGFIYTEANFPSAHASTIEELENGDLIAAWFGGTHERHSDVSIYTSTKTEAGWSSPRKVADGFENDTLSYPTWNPVLFNIPENLFLFYKIGPSPSTWWGAYKTSKDQGRTWSDKILLPEGVLGPIKNKPIQLENGRIVSPSSVELQDGAVWHAHMEISDDLGKTWRKIPVNQDSDSKVIQPTIIQLKNGDLKAFFRSDQDVVLESISRDDGENWSKFVESELANPNSGIDAVSLDSGGFLMVYNPMESGEDWWQGRSKLNLAYSKDGEHWEDVLELENKKVGEYSYPAIIQSKTGEIHITYTYDRKRIKYFRLKRVN